MAISDKMKLTKSLIKEVSQGSAVGMGAQLNSTIDMQNGQTE